MTVWPGLGVEGGGRLVADQQPRLVDQGAGDGDALLLAAGELARAGSRPARPCRASSSTRPACADGLARGPAGDEQRHGGVLGGGQGRQQVVLLEDEADVLAAEARPSAPVGQPRQVGAEHRRPRPRSGRAGRR